MRLVAIWSLVLFNCAVFAQELQNPDFDAVDSLYREDQFYVGFTYNILQNLPDGVRQNKFSPGIYAGFLRDMPFNKARTQSIAIGLGYALQNYNQNLIIDGTAEDASYSLIQEDEEFYKKNNLSMHFIELPIEYRWRTSTPESHKFWRIYTGIKVSYLLHSRSIYETGDKLVIKGNDDLNTFRYGVYLATGYNTWNFHLYYGLNPLFKSGTLNGADLELNTLNIGLMFYIL